jgi:DnaK suppressor protein
MLDLYTMRDTLEEKLHDLRRRKDRLTGELAMPLSADSGEQAVEREDDEAQAGEEHLLSDEIRAVEAALQRIEQGGYGRCTRCGEPIAHARLLAIPEAALCIDCAR